MVTICNGAVAGTVIRQLRRTQLSIQIETNIEIEASVETTAFAARYVR
jgi:hypothetical protein